MTHLSLTAALAAAVLLSGCANTRADYTLRHPRDAIGIGPVGDGNRNIATAAERFTQAAAFADNGVGTAYRETLQQAGAARRFGMASAYEASIARSRTRISQPWQSEFADRKAAADAAMQYNHDIGRHIGIRAPKTATLHDIADAVLSYSCEYGLWQIIPLEDSGYAIRSIALDADACQRAKNGIAPLDAIGFSSIIP